MASMTVRELMIRIRASFEKKGTKEAEKSIASFAKSVNRLNRRVLSALGRGSKRSSLVIGLVGAALVKAGSDAQEAESKFEAVFKDQADEARAWSESVSKSMGRSAFSLREFASSLQDTFVPLGFARDTASQMSRNLVELSEDVASFQNKASPEVMNDFTSALVGNHETIRKYGIIVTEARLKEKIAAMSKESEEFARTSEAQQKVLARMQLIFEGTSDAQGDATRTAGSFANQMKALKSTVMDTAKTVGLSLMPALTAIVQPMVQWVRSNQELIKMNIRRVIDGIAFAAKFMMGIVRALARNWEEVRVVLMAVASGYIASGIASIAIAIKAAAASAAIFAATLGRVMALGAAFTAGFKLGTWIADWMEAKGWLDAIADKIDEIVSYFTGDETVSEAREASRGTDTARDTRRRALDRTRENLIRLRERGVQSVRGIRLDDAGIDRLVGQSGFRMQQAAAGRASGAGTTNNMQVGAPQITVNVPPGTDANQAQRVAEAAGSATRSSMRQAIADVAR